MLKMLPLVIFFVFATHSVLVRGKCTECTISTSVYDDLKCIPKYSESNKCCPVEYDCSSIYSRPKGSCHLRGKYYTPGKSPIEEDVASYCDFSTCTCGKNGAFDCITVSDSCAEFWVPDFIQPGCYLAYEHNRCCHSKQVCPPFDENHAKCKVRDVTYKEGARFEHPTKKCTKCVCDKGFDGKLEAPTCLPLNCTAELRFSKQINEHCAPYYLNDDDCCPRNWICPSDDGVYTQSSIPSSPKDPKCTFGKRSMSLGEIYKNQVNECKCIIPPFLTCRPRSSE